MKHSLKFRGRPYDDEGNPLAEESVSAGPGHALCTCGELSPNLASGGKRRAWHKDHVAEIESSRVPQLNDLPISKREWSVPGKHRPATPPVKVEDYLVDLDPKTDGLAAYSIYTLPMPPQSVLVSARRPGPGRHPFNPFSIHGEVGAVTFVPFPSTVSKVFWPTFGIKGGREVAEAYPGVRFEAHHSLESATLSGEDPRAVREAALSVARLYDSAGAELRHYISTDEEYQSLSKSPKRAVRLRNRALLRYATRFAGNLVDEVAS